MIHSLRTYAIAVSAALTIALASGVARGSTCGDPKPGWLHADRIAELEASENPTAKDLYYLGSHHIKMGLLYDIAATSSAHLTVQAAQCYSEDPVQVWGAEYFGALAFLELERISDADEVAHAGAQRSGGPVELVALSRLLGRIAKLESAGEHPFSMVELEPWCRWGADRGGNNVREWMGIGAANYILYGLLSCVIGITGGLCWAGVTELPMRSRLPLPLYILFVLVYNG